MVFTKAAWIRSVSKRRTSSCRLRLRLLRPAVAPFSDSTALRSSSATSLSELKRLSNASSRRRVVAFGEVSKSSGLHVIAVLIVSPFVLFPLPVGEGVLHLLREQFLKKTDGSFIASAAQRLNRELSNFSVRMIARGANQDRYGFIFRPSANREHRLFLQLNFRT